MLRVSCKKLSLKKDDKILAIKNAVEFEVYDTGIGISKDNQENLFKIFGKVMQKNKSINKEGIGLGLYITRNLAIELGGTISVSSEEGVYTSFVVTLPIIQDLKEGLEQCQARIPALMQDQENELVQMIAENGSDIDLSVVHKSQIEPEMGS